MSFNKTIVASFVSAALGTATLGVAANDHQGVSSHKSIEKFLANKTHSKANVSTVNGMSNQYDRKLGTNTFQWAEKNTTTPNLGPVDPSERLAFAADFYLNQLTGISPNKDSGVSRAVLSKVHDIGRGAKLAKYQQKVAGIDVFNKELNVMMDSNFNLVASSGYFANKKVTQSFPAAIKNIDEAFGNSAKSIATAFAAMGGDKSSISLNKKELAGDYEIFDVANASNKNQLIGKPRAKRVFFEHKGSLVPAHYVEVESSSVDTVESEYYSYVVSAKTGAVLFSNNLKSHADEFNYRVYADANGYPWDSPHGNVIPAPLGSDVDGYLSAEHLIAPMITKSYGPISTKDAWLADGATTTSGNNVTAYVDTLPPQGLTDGDYMADITSANTFDYSYDTSLPEYSVNNRKAAIVNLFYMNNYLHDDYYDHGFDEASGNAQTLNYGRGGEEGDSLNVEVQDNSGYNNANMSTPADGYSPRMQMYLYDITSRVTPPPVNGEDFGLTVTSHENIGLLANIQLASFGPGGFDVSGDLVRISDGTAPASDGCQAAENGAALAGKIAIIDRGACYFTEKVKHAQNAGAIAVIIANNQGEDDPAPMGGSDPTITIPSIGISLNDGITIYELLDADETVSIKMFANNVNRIFKGSSWDNGTVTHEWGHYISNRLVGNANGLSNQQGRAMGEGFGDFHALLLLSAEDDTLVAGNEMYGGGYSDSTYTASFVTGIRPFPYSTDTKINPSSFEDVGLYPNLVHSPGSIWGNMLWESYVGLINDERHTFAEAQSLMKDYLVAGYKMMPMAPTYTEARDAILAAAYANDVDDYKVMLAAFAKRGMGLGAISPGRFDTTHSGVIESNKTELATVYVTEHNLNVDYEGLMTGYCSLDGILDKGETGTLSFTVENVGNSALTGVTGVVEVTSGHDVTFENDGMVTFGDVGLSGEATSSPIEFTLNEARTGDELSFKVTFPELESVENVDDYMLSTTVNVDFVERELTGYSQYESLNTLSRLNDFTETVYVGGERAENTFKLAEWGGGDGFIYASNNPFESDVTYETRDISVGYFGDFSISFWHYYDLEADLTNGFGYDGAVVEISVNGGEWSDVTEKGGTFDQGYSYITYAFGGEGRPAFSGDNAPYGGMETIKFGEILNGNEVKLRFRLVTDAYSSADGWYIDDLTINNVQNSIFSNVVSGDTFACDNRLPSITSISDTIAVNEGGTVNLAVEGSDPNGDELTYSWTQTGGIEVTMAGADTGNVSFTAPQVTGNQSLEFTAFVNDGTDSVSQTVTVNVKDTTVAVTPERPKRHGGSTTWLSLLLLPLLALRRRK